MADVRRVTHGDTKRRRWQLKQAGAVIPLDVATEVRMRASLAPGQTADGGADSMDGVCSIEAPAADGIIREPVGGTGALGIALFRVGFRVTFADGTIETVPDEETQLLEVIPGP